jgi:hypothetical protein
MDGDDRRLPSRRGWRGKRREFLVGELDCRFIALGLIHCLVETGECLTRMRKVDVEEGDIVEGLGRR